MSDRPPPFSGPRFRYAWKLWKAFRAEQKGEFEEAPQFFDEAEKIMLLSAEDRVRRALVLLKAQRINEAHKAFARLRDEFKGSEDADLRYLRHYCTHNLSLISGSSGQWAYEAKQAAQIDCRKSLKQRFPMATLDELDEALQPSG